MSHVLNDLENLEKQVKSLHARSGVYPFTEQVAISYSVMGRIRFLPADSERSAILVFDEVHDFVAFTNPTRFPVYNYQKDTFHQFKKINVSSYNTTSAVVDTLLRVLPGNAPTNPVNATLTILNKKTIYKVVIGAFWSATQPDGDAEAEQDKHKLHIGITLDTMPGTAHSVVEETEDETEYEVSMFIDERHIPPRHVVRCSRYVYQEDIDDCLKRMREQDEDIMKRWGID